MLGASYMTSLHRQTTLKRKYEAYNQARSRLSQSQDSPEPADKVPTTYNSVPHFPAGSPSSEQRFLSVPNFSVAQFPPSPTPFTTQNYFSTSAPISSSPAFQSFQHVADTSNPFPGQATAKTELGKLNPYPFNPTVGFALQPTELTNVTFNNQITPGGFRFDAPQFHTPGSFHNPPTTTTSTTTTSLASTPTPTPSIPTGTSNTPTSNTPMSPAPLSAIASISHTLATPQTFYNNPQADSSYASLKNSTEVPSPQAVSQQPTLNNFTFAPASPPLQRREKEWVRTKDKSTIVVIGPCNLGKKFLINTILSTTYETKRAPTLGRHRSDNNLHTHTPSHPPLVSSSNTTSNATTSTTVSIPSGPTMNPAGSSSNVSISITHNNVRSMFDFELIEPTPPIATDAGRPQTQEVDFEFPLDSSFLQGINWENERRSEMQEVYDMSQYCITKNYSVRDDRSFVIPQGVKKYSHTSQLFTISYDRTPQVFVSFLSESDLRAMLWQLHEHYEQGGKRSTLSPARLDFLHHIYRMAVDITPPLTGSTILSYLATSAELPLRASVRNMLGKVHRYIGAGRDAMVDRLYIREKIKEVLFKYQYLIKAIEVKVPASVLQGGRKEMVILSDTTAHGHIRSSHIVQSINSADMVLLAVDSNGLTNELASLLVSSRFLTKLTKDPRKIMALDLSEGRGKSNLRMGNSVKDHLVAQFRRMYRDVDSASLRNSLPKILSEMEVLTLKPLLFASLELNNSVPPEYQGKVSLQDLKSSTNMPLLLERIASLVSSEIAKVPNRGFHLPSPPIPDSKPPMSAEQLASSLKHRLHVTDGVPAIPNTTTTTTTTTSTAPTTTTATTTTTTTTTTTSAAPIMSPPILPPPSTPHATNPLLRSKFEYWQACMLSLITSNECDYEFARRANECSKRAYNDWEQHFRDQFMSNADNCSTILDPKYKGECLGVNISFLLCHDLTSWVPYFWRDSVLAPVSALQSEMHEFARRMLEAHAKAIDAKYSSPADSAVRMQQHTLLQYCQTTMEKSITTKFAALFEALKIDVSSLVTTICSDLLHSRLLSRSIGLRGLKQYHKLITDAMRVLPYDVAGAIKLKFTEIIKVAMQYLDPIEHSMDQLLISLADSQNQLKNMDPTMRQYPHFESVIFLSVQYCPTTIT